MLHWVADDVLDFGDTTPTQSSLDGKEQVRFGQGCVCFFTFSRHLTPFSTDYYDCHCSILPAPVTQLSALPNGDYSKSIAIAPQVTERPSLFNMMKLWRHLCRLSPRASHVKYEQIRDEERFETESDHVRRRQRTNRWVTLPSKAAVFLFLVNLVIIGLLLHTLEPLITLLRRNQELFSPRVVLPSPDISHGRNRTAGLNLIPLILHQTTATEVIPDHWIRSQKSCKQAYSKFEYKVYLSICNCESRQSAMPTMYHDIRTLFF